MNRQHATGNAIRTGLLDGGLRPRLVGRAEGLSGPSWFACLIDNGQAWVSDEDMPIIGPALTWRPWNTDERAKFSPGVTGCYILLGPSALANAIGHVPEARELRDIASVDVTVPLGLEDEALGTLRFAFRGLHRELASNGTGYRAAVEAYLRVILIEVHRARQSHSSVKDAAPMPHRIFTRFCDLVETHFRDRWTVNEYASALGISRDRLGDICRRVRGLGPKEFIDRRVALEARLQLEGSSLSIQQIAAWLGFASSPQFTRFFLRNVGVPPGRFRKAFEGDLLGEGANPPVLHDWP